MKKLLYAVMFFIFLNCAEKPYFSFNAFTDRSYQPTKDVLVYKNTNEPDMRYITIGEIIIRGGDYGFRLKKTIDMAKSAGGDALIIKGDKLGVRYSTNTMVSQVIRFISEEELKNKGQKDQKTNVFEVKEDDQEIYEEGFEEDDFIPEEFIIE